jgi:Uncharacterized Rossmann fold enzyme
MNFEEWEPLYQLILEKFNFLEKEDEAAARLLSEYFKAALMPLTDDEYDPTLLLNSKINGKTVFVCGNAPSLEKELLFCLEKETKDEQKAIFIAADGAASVLLKHKQMPDIIVTDLDGKHSGDVDKEIEAAELGAVLLIHAHGDNSEKLQKYLPPLTKKIREQKVIPTCQCRPPDYLYNFGGFTDGDRCVFLAEAFDAEKIILLGFNFEDSKVTEIKKKKLQCAKNLIRIAERKHPDKIIYFYDFADI